MIDSEQRALANKMAVASSHFRSFLEEDLDSLLVEAVPEKTKVATKYGMKIFNEEQESRMTFMNLLLIETLLKIKFSKVSIDTFFVNKF